MFYGKDKNITIEYHNGSSWTTLHDKSSPITTDYSGLKLFVSLDWTYSLVGKVKKVTDRGGIWVSGFMFFYLKISSDITNIVSAFNKMITMNEDKDWFRVYPDKDTYSSTYLEMNVSSFKAIESNKSHDIYRLDLETREKITTLTVPS